MAVSLERRYRLMEIIRKLEDEALFEEVENKLQNKAFMESVKPLRKSISIEELKREQNYKPINKEEFFRKVEELAIEEPLEDLLAMLDWWCMNYLIDTNILVVYIRDDDITYKLEEDIKLLTGDNTLLISVVSIGEIKSIALTNYYG